MAQATAQSKAARLRLLAVDTIGKTHGGEHRGNVRAVGDHAHFWLGEPALPKPINAHKSPGKNTAPDHKGPELIKYTE